MQRLRNKVDVADDKVSNLDGRLVEIAQNAKRQSRKMKKVKTERIHLGVSTPVNWKFPKKRENRAEETMKKTRTFCWIAGKTGLHIT